MADNHNKKCTIEELRNAPASGAGKLDDAQFPCYGVRCVYPDGRVVEEFYPEGIDDPGLPWERDDNKDGKEEEK